MASSSKFDLSSSSPGRPLYSSGKRGSYTASSMDRSSSFHENMENPILSSLPSMSRSTMNVSQGDVTNFFQCLRFDLKSMAAEYKCNRHGDVKRLANAALCTSDGSPSGSLRGKLPFSSPEDLKRLKVGLRESTIKARERVKIFSEVLSVINKCFPSIPSRKRSRPDAFSGDHSNVLLADRIVAGVTVGKMGIKSHALTSAFDYEQQKVEERGKNVVPNKRTRTSMVDQRADVRPNTPVRSSGSIDRDREVLRLPNSNTLQGADRALPIVADGWEKAKMKKKRAGVKADAAPSTSSVLSKPIEPTQGMHPRSFFDARSRLNDPQEFRLGAANGILGAGKADGPYNQASMGMRSSVPRPEQENTSILHDKRDQNTNLEQERTNFRALNKASVREDFISGTTSSTTKLHAAARGPRSGSGVVPKLSHVQRATVSNGLDSPHVTSKNPGAISSTNRSGHSARSSSPPVAQWADRRPHKISLTARRTNFVPVASTNDEVSALANSDITVSEKGRGFARRFPVNSPKQFKSKGDLKSSTLSESEESGAAEIRSRDNSSKSEEVEDKAGLNVQKMSTLVLPTRKNKFMNEDDLASGGCRQRRTVRCFASAGSVGNVGTAKQLRTGRVNFDKPESKIGRPATRKLSGRQAYLRQKHSAFSAATDFLDDGHEELLAAANAVINPGCALSIPFFWRQTDALFGFVSDSVVTYVKQEGSVRSTFNTSNPVDNCDAYPNGVLSVEPLKNGTESSSECSEDLTSGTSPRGVSLCQRLLTALISEDNEYTWCGNDGLNSDVYGSAFEPETDVESNSIDHRSLQNFKLGESFSSSYMIYSTLRSCNELVHSQSDTHLMSMPESAIATGFDHCYNGLISDPGITPTVTSSQCQYGNMRMEERLLIEIHSLGLYPTRVPDLVHPGDEDICEKISRLEEKHHQQVSRKKRLLDKLLKSTEEAREQHEKEFEQMSLEKLTEMAYQKYMSCWGPSAPGGKSVGGKMAKQAALNFVKRTLERCHKYETTGKSCFTEPLFRDMFLSGLSRLNDAEVDSVNSGESGKVYGSSIETFSGTQLSSSLNNHDIYSSEPIGKEDVWSSRDKKRELYLDNVAGVACTSSGMPSGVGRAIMNSVKGKRSDRNREGKGNGSRTGDPQIGRPASGNVKGERKTKAKLKQKTTQLSASVNGPLGKFSDQQRAPTSSVPKSTVIEKDESVLMENCEEPLDLSHLQLPGMDDFGVGDDFGGQGEDIGSWLNIDDDVLQHDGDFMGLEIPMDDLTDLNMMV